ncbi:Cyclic nucleotide-binding domain-containing protein [Mariprofundus aestuarium]|uniref:Cyclic nucleotide-binding domain-containing protein n=1 Tax=Mariprofundus aestuarium TaxID=1921086 RepID=A0A2K8KWM8_MARES|nr:cyclic nucleotide-binding domain-containing protein [Mariprofundus aestuarium]ATX79310.1 Cyclic nucleotide-binding domain-containing protein [Mariprofundus aestuarium]
MRLGSIISGKQRSQNRIGGISHIPTMKNRADYLETPFNHPEYSINEMIVMTGAIPLFDKIESEQIGVIAAHMKTVHLDANQQLFAEGEKSDYICFIVSGTVDVVKQSQTGLPVSVSTLSRGRSIGEMALIDAFPRSASVIARTPCTLLKITRESFDKILEERPRAGVSFMRALSQGLSLHLRRTSGQFADAYESTGLASAHSDTKEAATRVANKTTKLIDLIINRKPSNLVPLVRQYT